MTTSLRGLLVEDKPTNAELIERYLDLEFDVFGWNVKWTVCGSALEARMVVQKNDLFDFAIVDYDLGEGEQTGRAVVSQLRGKGGEQTFILMITSVWDRYPNFQVNSLQAGANYAITRGELIADSGGEWTFQRLASKIRNQLLARDNRDGLVVKFFDDDIGIMSTLYSLGDPPLSQGESAIKRGERIARSLTIECLVPGFLPETTLEVRHLAPGRSGAHVCRVDKFRHGDPTESFVLKIGLDRNALEHERRLNEAAGRVLTPETLVQMTGGVKLDETSGYAAIAARMVARAITLASWLTEAPADAAPDKKPRPHRAREVAESLFGEALIRLFEPSLQVRVPISKWLAASPVLQLRAQHALSRYADVWSHAQGAARRDAATLSALLSGLIDSSFLPVDASNLKGETTFTAGFGDLHSTNVLVQQGVQDRPMLVDASLFGTHHWAADMSRLLVDLVLRVRRHGADSMLWNDFGDACAYADGLCYFARHDDPLDDPEDITPVDAFILHSLTKLPTFLQVNKLGMPTSDWHWQWHVAIGKELLRQGTRPDMVPPRAVMALTSAAHHIRVATRLVEQVDHVGDNGNLKVADCGPSRDS